MEIIAAFAIWTAVKTTITIIVIPIINKMITKIQNDLLDCLT